MIDRRRLLAVIIAALSPAFAARKQEPAIARFRVAGGGKRTPDASTVSVVIGTGGAGGSARKQES